jgi:hypothetical protein
MDDKDKIIEELKLENETLQKKLKSKETKKSKTKFALDNLDYFEKILDIIKTQDRYTFTRKGGQEKVIKINAFVNDLLVAKIKLGGNVPDNQIGTRLSMDEHSLIKFLSSNRVKKEGAGKKKEEDPKPPKKEVKIEPITKSFIEDEEPVEEPQVFRNDFGLPLPSSDQRAAGLPPLDE